MTMSSTHFALKQNHKWINIYFFVSFIITGEYIQLPLQLEEILQDVLQLANLANDNDQVVSEFAFIGVVDCIQIILLSLG